MTGAGDQGRDRRGRPSEADTGASERAAGRPTADREGTRPAPEPDTTAARRGGPRPGGWAGLAYDIATSVVAVLVVGVFLFTVSGVWPPLVAVESGSMVPHMTRGDLVFVMEEQRFPGGGAVGDTGVVTADRGERTGYRTFQGAGDVIVYAPDGSRETTPIIHRAMFWVERGEDWSERADPAFLTDTRCEVDRDPATDTGIPNCPAPHAGFITKGDANGRYDQVTTLSDPVKPDWVVGTAELRIPGLGWIRLQSQ